MKVILATDGSAPALEATRFLLRLPIPQPVEVTLVANVFVPSHDTETTDPLLKDYRQHQEDQARGFLDEAESILSLKAASIQSKLVHGHIGHSIVEAANELDSDLIVLGATGHSAIGRMLLGSVSDYVATHATCSVVTVRGSEHHEQSDSLKLTIAYNDSPAAQKACDEIATLKWDASASIRLLTVIPTFDGFSQELLPDIARYRSEQRAAAMRYLEEGRKRFDRVESYLSSDMIESPHVGESIVSHLIENDEDLVVVGDSHRGRITRMLLGSVSRFVLHHATCSVWISR